MWKILLRVLLQNNNHRREKHCWYISLQNIQAKTMVPTYFLPTYSRTLHLKKKEEYVMVIWPTLQKNRREKTDNAHHPIDNNLWKVNTLPWSKQHMWNNVTVLEEHTSGTPLYTPGKFWYTLGCTIHLVDKHWYRALHPILYATPNLCMHDFLKLHHTCDSYMGVQKERKVRF